MTEPGGGGVHRVDVVVDCSVDGGRGFEILSLLPSSFLPSFLPAIPGGIAPCRTVDVRSASVADFGVGNFIRG